MILKMLDAGMNCVRLDFKDGDHKTHSENLDNLRNALRQRPDHHCAIMMETMGPEVSIAYLRDNSPVQIMHGQKIKIVTDVAIEGDASKVACTFKALP
jgi:pyruvate kinase